MPDLHQPPHDRAAPNGLEGEVADLAEERPGLGKPRAHHDIVGGVFQARCVRIVDHPAVQPHLNSLGIRFDFKRMPLTIGGEGAEWQADHSAWPGGINEPPFNSVGLWVDGEFEPQPVVQLCRLE